MKKVVSLVLTVLVAVMLSAQVFATSSPSSSDILVTPKEGFLVTVQASSYPASTPGEVVAILNDVRDELSGKNASYFTDYIAGEFNPSEFEIYLIFDASPLPIGSTDGPTSFTIKAGTKSSDKVHVMHKVGGVDGEWKEESATISGENIVITTDGSYSAFVVLKTASSSDGTSPATGDRMAEVYAYGFGALVFTAAAVLLLRKRENA